MFKNPSVTQISGFWNQLYLKSNLVNQHNFLHADVDRLNDSKRWVRNV